jgi:hypothetical protein
MADEARHLGDDWIVVPSGGGAAYLQRDSKTRAWRLVAVVHDDRGAKWRAEYRDFQSGLPHTIHLAADDRSRFDLSLSLSQVETNTPIDAAAFSVRIPPSASPITLAELRDMGALQ